MRQYNMKTVLHVESTDQQDDDCHSTGDDAIRGRGETVRILDDITLEIPEKQTVAIVRPVRQCQVHCWARLRDDRPTSGTIWLNGREITRLNERRWRACAWPTWDISFSPSISFRR